MGDVMQKKAVFMGTPAFAAEILKALLNMDCLKIIGVVSQPDKRVGRKQVLTQTPVKEVAKAYDIPVFQPTSVKTDYQTILDWQPDLVITCAYGQMVPDEVLFAFGYPCVNVHASLLPKYRGGAPIHKAIINGETKTGVTLMQMVKKMDAGMMYATCEVEIEQKDTAETLHDKLAVAGCKLVYETIPLLLDNKLQGKEQNEEEVTFAWNIKPEEEMIDCHRDAMTVYNQIRGLISWPVGHILLEGKKVKLWAASLTRTDEKAIKIGNLYSKEKKLYLKCQTGSVEIKELQLEGKKRCTAQEFLNGFSMLLKND